MAPIEKHFASLKKIVIRKQQVKDKLVVDQADDLLKNSIPSINESEIAKL